MTLNYGPFGGTAWPQANWYRTAPVWAPSGVFGPPANASTGGDLALSFNGLNASIGLGRAWIRGTGFEITDAAYTFNVPANANVSNQRRDRVVLRRDLAAQTVTPALKQGTASSSPVAPSLVQSEDDVWEIPLYSFLVPVNSGTTISGIIDERVFTGPGGAAPYSEWGSAPRQALTAGAGIPAGVLLFDASTGRYNVYDGANWDYAFGASPPRIAFPAASGWDASSSGESPLEYWMGGDGIVHLEGHIVRTGGSFTPGSVNLGTLPAGFRPGGWKLLTVPTNQTGDLFLECDISTAGVLRAVRNTTGSVPNNTVLSIAAQFPAVN